MTIETAEQGAQAVLDQVRMMREKARAVALEAETLVVETPSDPLARLTAEQLAHYIQKEAEHRVGLAECQYCEKRRAAMVEASLKRTAKLESLLELKSGE